MKLETVRDVDCPAIGRAAEEKNYFWISQEEKVNSSCKIKNEIQPTRVIATGQLFEDNIFKSFEENNIPQ